jgi:hypothetical protein
MIKAISLVKFRKRILPVLRICLIAGILGAIIIRLFMMFFKSAV